MRTVPFQAIGRRCSFLACSKPPVADADIHREALQARGRLSCRETPRDKNEVLKRCRRAVPQRRAWALVNDAIKPRCTTAGKWANRMGRWGKAPLKTGPDCRPATKKLDDATLPEGLQRQ
jgi:hypothetical protein